MRPLRRTLEARAREIHKVWELWPPRRGDPLYLLPEPKPNPLAPSSGGRHVGLGPGGGRSPQAITSLKRKGTPAFDGRNPSHSPRPDPDPRKGEGEGKGVEI
jgi:hypothetical protein